MFLLRLHMPKQSRPASVQVHRPWLNISMHNARRVARSTSLRSLTDLKNLRTLANPRNLSL